MGTAMMDTNLSKLRKTDRRWVIEVIAGPNMKHLGKRDRRLFGGIESFAALDRLVTDFGAALGVEVRTFVSDFEGEILERVHASAARTDGYIVDPGGLATVSQGWPHALLETRKPVVEVCFYNPVVSNEHSVFTKTAIGNVTGLREHSYTAALLALVLSLDDETFLDPDGPDSETKRAGGTPYSFKLA
jgi:3-dehydroquinate dehydratase II